MKDYSLTEKERSKFILSYKVENGMIHIKFPKKRVFFNFLISLFKKNSIPYIISISIPYTKETEQRVIETMEKQVERADFKLRVGIFADFDKMISRFHFAFWTIMFGGLITSSAPIFVVGFLLELFGTPLFCGFRFWLYYISQKMPDLEKSKLFIDNQEIINKYLDNTKALNGLSRKTVAKVEEVKSSGKPFNINDIDKLPLKDLKQLKANIDRIMLFGFDEEPTTIEQGFQKTKQ